MRVRNKK